MSIYMDVHKMAEQLKQLKKTEIPVERKLTGEQAQQIEELGHS